MNKLDFDAINQALNAEQVVPQWLADGHRRGAEWVARNPRRADNNPGSFTINLVRGVWVDYAAGPDARGSDLISLYAYLFHGSNQGEAAKELAQNHGVKIGDPVARQQAADNNVHRIEEAKPEPVMPVPFAASEATFTHHEYGEPTSTWSYTNADGDVLLYVCRFDPPGMRKQIIPRSWCLHPGKPARWTWRGITGKGKRPLLNAAQLAANPDADAVVVEGEKTADAASQLFGDAAICTTWLGGGETAALADIKLLAGRRVILWPDFDSQKHPEGHPQAGQVLDRHEQPGLRAMMAIAQNLKGVAREIIMVGYTPGGDFAGGWDLADALAEGWTTEDAATYMAQNSGDAWHIAGGRPSALPPAPAPATALPWEDAAPAPGDGQPPAPPANDNTPRLPMDATVNPFGFPHVSDKGQPMNTAENLEYMLGEYGIVARYNEVRKTTEVEMPGRFYSADNRANCTLAEIISMAARNRMPQGMLADYTKLLADRNAYNPVKDWIESKPWDGTSRIKAMCETVSVEGDRALTDKLIFRWLISAVAAVYMPHGFESHGVLVFTGNQGQGKTKWIKRLVADHLLDVVLVGAVLDPNNKDTVTNAVSHWLVELGELDATFRKADIARLKSFVTNAVDKVRRPYDRIETEYQRRTVFFASVNEERYLVDDTGNRRWWTIPVTAIDYGHAIDVQQLWAEILTVWQAGEQHWLTDDEFKALNTMNAEHESIDPVEEMILGAFDWDELPGMPGRVNMTASDVLLVIGFDKPSKAQATHASKVLKKITGGDPKHMARGRFFSMPKQIKRRLPERFGHNDESRPF